MSFFFLFLSFTAGVSSIGLAMKTLSWLFLDKSPRLLLNCRDNVLLIDPSLFSLSLSHDRDCFKGLRGVRVLFEEVELFLLYCLESVL